MKKKETKMCIEGVGQIIDQLVCIDWKFVNEFVSRISRIERQTFMCIVDQN